MTSKLNVLYVEDHEISRNSVVNSLNLLDCIGSITTAKNGQEALEMYLKEQNFDILITDINMPHKNGLSLINDIKKYKDIFSIITTAYDEANYLKESIKNRVDKYLVKPLDVTKLLNVIKNYYDEQIEEFKKEHFKDLQYTNIRLDSLEEILGNLAHQWRQPLNLIAMQSSSLSVYNDLDKLNKEDLKKSLDIISKTTLELSSTLDNLNHLVQKSNDYKFKYIKDEVITLLYELDIYNNSNISLKLDIEENLGLKTLWKDLSLVIKEILLNCIEQFEDKSIDNPKIEIKAYKDEKFLLLKISDNAKGIDSSIKNRIFEPYSTTKFKATGKGLGLYTSYKIVKELLGGNIYAKNENAGAVFTLKL